MTEFLSVGVAEIDKVSSMFDVLMGMRIKLHKNVDEKVLEKAFRIHVQNVVEKLDSRIKSLDYEPLKQVEITMAKHGLYDAVFQQVVLLCSSISPVLGDTMKDLRMAHAQFMSELQSCAFDAIERSNNLDIQLANSEGSVVKLQETAGLLDKEADTQQEQITKLRQQLHDTTIELSHLRTGGGVPSSSSPYTNVGNQLAMDTSLNSHAYQHSSSISSNSGNIQIRDAPPPPPVSAAKSTRGVSVGRSAKSTAASRAKSPARSTSVDRRTFNTSMSQAQSSSSSSSSVMHRSELMIDTDPPDGMEDSNCVARTLQLHTPSRGQHISLVAPSNWLHGFRIDIQRAFDDNRCREISLKELKETIEKVYESKLAANSRALQGIGTIPIETLEQHTYRVMEKKYGLRNLAVEHVGKVLLGVKRYGPVDSEVAVFNSIFRNEIEEEFRDIQMELVKSIRDLAMVQIMSKHPTKPQPVLTSLLESKITGGVVIEEDWKDMVNYLYSPQDSHRVNSILRSMAADRRDPNTPTTLSVMGSSGTYGTNKNYSNKSEGTFGYDRNNSKDRKRLGYSSPSLKISATVANPQKNRNDMAQMPFPLFMKLILDFQLHTHQDYLKPFLRIFQKFDQDADGVINAAEFKDVFIGLKCVVLAEQMHETEKREKERAEGTLVITTGTTAGNGNKGKPKNGGGHIRIFSSEKEGPVRQDPVVLGDSFDRDDFENVVLRVPEHQRNLNEAEAALFLELLREVDPQQSDRVIFSNAVKCVRRLHLHILPTVSESA